MKKLIILVIFALVLSSTLAAGDIPFLAYFTIGEEKYVKQQILKCKDVESVEIELFFTDNYDTENYDIHVYLTNNRYITFADVQLGRFIKNDSPQGVSIFIWQINNLHPAELRFRINRLDDNNILYESELKGFETKFLPKIMPKTQVDNILDIINNFDEVYTFIKNLPELPVETPFFEEIPSEEISDAFSFSLIEKEDIKNNAYKYKYGYNFYKMTIENAQKKYTHGKFKTDF